MGVFVAIEGGDGSGKGTQTKILAEYAEKVLKKNVFTISFPQHGAFSSYYADQYLNGVYGGVNHVHADLASLPYAIDRFAASPKIREVLDDPNGLVIADRYVASNLAHQGSKFSNEKERHEYYDRMMRTEFEVLGIPKPDVNIILLVPSDVAQENIDKKEARGYTDMKRDIHEEDVGHLDRTKANYEELTKLYPDWFKAIDCMKTKGEMRSIKDIQEDIITLLKQHLALL
jgi:dTMP kinase